MAKLRIAAEGLDPRAITDILATSPKVAARRGERLYKDGHSKAVAQEGTWFVTTEGMEEASPSDHLQRLLALVSLKIERLRRETPGVTLRFTLLVSTPDYGVERLPKQLLSRIERLGEFDLDIIPA